MKSSLFGWLGEYAEGLVAVVLGCMALGEAARIREVVRPTSPAFGVVGPDGYLFVIGGLLTFGGIAYLAAGGARTISSWRSVPASVALWRPIPTDIEPGEPHVAAPGSDVAAPGSDVAAGSDGKPEMRRSVIVISLMLITYVFCIDLIGFTVSTFVFLVPASKLIGMKTWRMAALFAAVLTTFTYVLFVRLAQMPLPTGFLF